MMYIHQMGSLNDFLHLVAIHRVAQDDDDCHVASLISEVQTQND